MTTHRKSSTLFRRAALMLLLTLGISSTIWAQNSPEGILEVVGGIPGSIHVKGWCQDPDDLSTPLTVQVYVKDNNNQPVAGYNPIELTANKLRNGEDNQLHNNGYETYLFIATAGTYKVDVIHVDATSDGSAMSSRTGIQVSAPYTVTYNANGGNGAPAQQLKGENIDLTLSTTQPSNGSYGFICWNTASNGGGTSYPSGGTYSGNGNVTLYAMWTASFIPGSGTQADPYLISSTEQWNLFANNVNSGNTYNGKWVRLGADITVSTMAGKQTRPFKGTFDGAGHTMNLAIDGTTEVLTPHSNSEDYLLDVAPFRYVDGATFIDLNLTGFVKATEYSQYGIGLGGLVGLVAENHSVRILNCRSSVDVSYIFSHNLSGWGDNYTLGNMGGFIGTNAGTVIMDNCLFDGTLAGRPEYVGGFVGRQTPGTMTMSNCLMNGSGSGLYGTPQTVKITFCEVPSNAQHLTMTNCYYTNAMGTAQGTQTSNTGEALRSQLGSGWIVNGSGQVVPGGVARYTITIDENIANGTIASSDAVSIPGETITLTVVPDQGYYGASVTYNDGTAHNLTPDYNECSFTMPEANVTVTGTILSSTVYTITYDLDGGSVATDNPTSYTEQSHPFTLVNPTRDGYTFAGWTGTGISGTSLNVTVPHGSTGDRTYTATWAINCTITYNLNGGTLPAPNPTVYSAMSDDITLVAPIRSGYVFSGWTGTELSQATVNVVIPHGSTGNRTYTATWTSTNYTISYNLDNGSVSPANPTSYTLTTPSFTLNNPTRSGHTFKGWVGTGIDGQVMTVTIPVGSVGNRSYTAIWALNGNVAYQAYNTYTDQFETRYAYNPTAVGTGTSWGSNNSETWYVLNSNVTVDGQISVNGTVNLILYDNCTLTVSNCIHVDAGKTLNIYSQSGGTNGAIVANSSSDHAGIGGGSIGTICIHGGTITATGGAWSAGIGGGTNGGGGNIAIYGGDVKGTAWRTHGGDAAGIGPGSSGSNGNLTIADGVRMNSCDYSARSSHMRDQTMRFYTCTSHSWSNGRCRHCNKRQNLKVNYNANNATSGSVPTDATQYSNAGTGTATVLGNTGNLQRTGFVFARWNTAADGSGTSYSAGQTFQVYHDVTLYAYWAEVYPITYDLAGGSLATANPTGYHLFSDNITLNNPTREGYTFVGWTGSNGNTPQQTVVIPAGSIGARTYTANWAPIVHLAVNTDNTQAIAQSSTQPFTTVVLDGYTFRRDGSWNTLCLPFALGNFTGTPLEGATVKTLSASTVTGNTLTASFEETSSTVAGKPYIVKWESAQQPLNALSNPMFVNVSINSTTQQLNTTTTYADFVGSYAPFSVGSLLPDTANLACNAFHGALRIGDVMPPTGYLIGGWYTDAGLTIPATSVTIAPSGEVTLYALYTPISYTVAFDANTGTGSMASQSFTYDAAQNLTASTFTRTGYLFAGWSTTTGGPVEYTDGQSVSNLASEDGATVTLYAQWTPITYTVHFNKNHADATGIMADQTLTYDASESLTANAFVRTDFGFTGWSTTAGGSIVYGDGESVLNLANGQDDVVNLYAQWSEAYTIDYNLAGGSVATPNPATYTEFSPIITLVNPARPGYTFTGWTGTGLSEATMEVTIPMGSMGNRSYTATWTPTVYTIDYELAGGSVATDNPTTYTIESEEITLVNPTRTGYTFAGWTGTDLTEATTTVTIPTGSYGDRSFVATWAENTLTLAADADNNAAIAAANGLVYDVTLDGYTLYRDGSWNTICLPFDIDDLTGTPLEGATIKEMSNSEFSTQNSELIATFVDATSIEAGKPYIVKWTDEGLGADLVIRSQADWNTFASNIGNYQNKIVKLATNLNVTSMVNGTFKGTLDGCGHTITINLTSNNAEEIALFHTLQNATVKNLKIAGSISFHKHRPASIASYVSGTSTVMNCWSTVAISSNYTGNDWIDAGAFVARVNSSATLNMTNCLFTGSVSYKTNNYQGGGMVGWTQSGAIANLSHCYFKPSSLTFSKTDNSTYIFVSGNVRGNLLECYYRNSNSYLKNEGTQTTATGETLRALLGDGWQVVGGNVVPKMENTVGNINNPVFTDVTISNAQLSTINYQLSTFSGSYAPISDGLLDSHNANGNAQHVSLNVSDPTTAPTGYNDFIGWYINAEKTVAATSIPFAADGNVTLYAKFTPCTYSVRFNKNSDAASGTMENQQFNYDEAQNLSANSFVTSTTGYHFGGWSTTADGPVVYSDGQSVINLASQQDAIVDLYAQWTAIVYSITYNLGGGSLTTTHNSYTVNDATITLDNPTRTGYTFAGWYDNSGFTGNAVTVIPTGSTGDTVLWARWTPIVYTISYDLADGTVATPNPTSYTIESEPITLVNPTKEGYSFYGWTGTGIANATMTVTIETGSYGDRTYTANWKRVLTLYSDADNTATITAADGETIDSLFLSGYTFYRNNSWNTFCVPFDLGSFSGTPLESATVKSLEATDYTGGTLTMSFADATTIEAGKPYIVKWTEDALSYVDADIIIRSQADWNTFAANVNNGTETYEGKTVKLAADITVSTMVGSGSSSDYNAAKKFQGTFDGCGHTLTVNISANQNGVAPFRFVAGATFRNLTVSGSVTNNSSGKETAGLIAYVCGETTISNCVVSASVTCKKSGDCSNGGYIARIQSGVVIFYNCLFDGKLLGTSTNSSGGFVGWRNANNTPLTFNNCLFKPSEVTMGSSGSCTFNRAANSSSVCNNCYYTAAYGTAQGTQTSATGGTLRSQLGDGWEVDASGNVVPIMQSELVDIENPVFNGMVISNTEANVTTEHVTFSGSYAPNSEGLLDSNNPDGDALHAAIDINNSINDGYIFNGWYSDAQLTQAITQSNSQAINPIPFAEDGSVTLYANRTPVTYTVRFNKNSDAATGTMADQTFTYDVAQPLTANSFAMTGGLNFVGWSTTENGLVDFTDGQNVMNLAAEQGAVVNLYAIWTTIYSIDYDLAGGSVATDNPATYSQYSSDITLVNPTRDHYDFAGWTGTDLTEATMTVTIPTGSTGNRSYTATWTPVVYSISYDLAGGSVATDNPITYTIESEAITLVNPTREGYTFAGWIESVNSLLSTLNPQLSITIPTGSYGDRSYTATWTENTLTLAADADNNADITAANGLVYDVTLGGYTFYRDGSWNTLCVPFDLVSITGTPLEGATIKELTNSEFDSQNSELSITFSSATGIEAGKPYLVKWDDEGLGADLVIRSAADWDAFATNVNNGTDSYQSKTVKLAADISVTTMVGVESHKFQGIFDGCGHTLTVNLTGVGTYGAPFQYLNGATIRNLHTAGSISGTDILEGGIAGRTYGTTRIENCRSSVSLTSTKGDNAAMGGIAGVAESGSLIVTNCLFDGELLGSSNTNCAGIVNWRRNSASINISNTLFAPAQVTVSTSGASTIARVGSVTNCYYTQTLGTAQGTAVGSRTAAELAAALGSGWQVSGESVVPTMQNTVGNIANPLFENVVIDDSPISTFNSQLTTFTGSYAPITEGLLDEHNPQGDAQHASLSISEPTAPTGYADFIGWYSDSERTVAVSTFPISTFNSQLSTFTLYAKWSPVTYTVHFNKNNEAATGTMDDQAFTYDEAQPLTPNGFTVTSNFDFAGWSTTIDGLVEFTDGQNVMNLATVQGAVVNLYAIWTTIYTIDYDLAGGTVAGENPATYSQYSGDITLVNPTREYYDFAGWTGTDLTEATMTVVIPSGSTGNRSYTATWTPITYSIIYDLAGGSMATDNPVTYNIETPTFTLVNPTKAGYNFAGWTGIGLDAASTTVTIDLGSTGDRSYTATWTPVTYMVRFNKNSDAATGTMENQLFTYDVAQNLTSNSFTTSTPDYGFAGWSTTADGEVVYSDGQSVSNLASQQDAVVDLYAQWTPISYSITYHLGGGSLTTTNYSYTVNDATITLDVPTRTYYDFAGWYDNSGFTGDAVTVIAAGSTGNVELWAKWTPITYTISYDLAGGSVATPNPTSYTIESEPITLVNPERDGYYFVGWTGTDLATTTATVVIPTGSTGVRSYTANWIDYGSVVPYLAYDTTTGTFETQLAQVYTTVSSSTTAMADGWYVVNSNTSINNRIEVTGTVNLILCDGKTLTDNKGLHVPSGVTLNIYGQNAGTGSIAISGSGIGYGYAGIGGNDNQNGGTLSIHGGIVTTKGGSAGPGIGGGEGGGYNGGSVAIYGGTVNATGGNYAAGIGGGDNGSAGCTSVVITGGTVNATGSYGGAGIGGGWNGNGGNSVVISGGIVNATGGSSSSYNGAGIGGGRNGAGYTTVTITGGIVTAIAGNSSAQAIGRGQGSSASGTLVPLGEIKVFASADATEPVAPEIRVNTCRSAYARLEPCREHQWVANRCPWCGATCPGVAYGRNNATGGTAPVDNTHYSEGETVTVLGNTGNLERTGYIFDGWNTAADGGGDDYEEGNTFTFGGDTTLYAMWSLENYNISYELAGGQWDSQPPTSYTIESDDITLVNPTKEGYLFGGWTGTGLTSATIIVTIASGSTGDREYTAHWLPILEYRAYDTTEQQFDTLTADAYLDVTSGTTAMSGGWYAVRSNTTVSSRIEVTGTVNLILCDGATLTAPKGLHVPSGVTLNIYGQSEGTGTLTVTGGNSNIDYGGAGIGANNKQNAGTLYIHGGVITTRGGSAAPGIGGGQGSGYNGGTVAIYGGTVNATAESYGAGIGGGDNGGTGCISLVISGGTVNATGGSGGAGIGGGWEGNGGGTVTITGGIVNATGGNNAAGIGGGKTQAGCTSVNISGGIVTAMAGSNALAIGRGSGSSGNGGLTLEKMKVFANANATQPVAPEAQESTCRSSYAKLMPCTEHHWVDNVCTLCGAINNGVAYSGNGATSGTVPVDATEYTDGADVTVLGNTGNLVRAGYNFAGWNTAADGGGDDYEEGNTFPFSTPTMLYAQWSTIEYSIGYDLADGSVATENPTVYTIESDPIMLVNPTKEGYFFLGWSGTGLADITHTVVIPTGSTGDRTYTANWLDMENLVTYRAYNTTLEMFETLAALDYTPVTSLTTAMSNGWYVVNSNTAINSRIEVTGTVNLILCDGATLTDNKGLQVPSGVTLNIYGQTNGTGILNAVINDYYQAAIGGNNDQNGGTITIHGGVITATGGDYGAGIGGGYYRSGGTVSIYGGTVTATSPRYGAGIGGGYYGYGGTVTITGGTVTATGGNDGGAGIGGGYRGNGGTVVITGGSVTTIANNSSAQAIGQGINGSGSGNLTIGEMSVYESPSATLPVTIENRISTCRTTYARIEPCTEHQWVENICSWCGATCNGVVYGRNHATGGTAPVDNTNYAVGQAVTVLDNTGNLERTGYTYVGWNSTADGNGIDYTVNSSFAYSGNITIYAKWNPITYNITYNLDGGNETTPNPTNYTPNDEITLVNPTKEGFAFGGWTGTDQESPTTTLTIAAGSTGDRTYTAHWLPALEYLAYNTNTHNFDTLSTAVYLDVTQTTTAMSNEWYAVRSNLNISSRIEVTGIVNLILCDGATLTVPKGMHVPSGVTLNIYGQGGGSGALTITNVDGSQAAIGGNSSNANHEDGGTVTIHGGVITAISTYDAAGIGGSDYGGKGGNVTIHGGTVTATGKDNAAGIGGGYQGTGGTVTITGGTVTSTGGSSGGAGIGGAKNNAGGSVTITGGTVIAIAGNSSAQAIGRGQGSSASGSLAPFGDMKVFASADATEPVDLNHRDSICRTAYARIQPCNEHNWIDNVCNWCGAVNTGVAYVGNGATSGTVPIDATTYNAGDEVTVLGNGNLVRTGYEFTGWNTAADSSGTNYATNATFLFSAPVTLYAKWNLITYTISYNGIDGATFVTPNPANYTVESDSITLVNPTKEGYIFYGWTGSDLSSPTMTVTIPTGSTGNRSYTAVWALDTITLLNNADNSSAIAAANGNLSLGVTLSGYTFYRDGSWNTLCVPFDLNAFAGTPLEGATVKTLQSSAYDDGTLTMNMTNDLTAIEAGTPYIVKWSEPDFVISSQADWNTFANNIGNYQNKIVKLATDLSITSMVGGTFKGTLDGCGHTITVSLSGGYEELAIFTTLENATIKNLKIEGTINFDRHRPASIASYIAGTTTIMNCWSSVTLTSNYNPSSADWVDGGAFVARVNSGATLNMSDCLFTGSVTYNAKNNQGGGMVGWAQGSSSVINLTHCLFAPSAMTMTATDPKNKTYVFVSGEARGNLTGCYYNTVAQNVNASVLKKDGTYTTATGEELQALLGNGWNVVGESVVPKMVNTVNDESNPVFANVIIDDSPLSTLNSQLSTFFGSYAPITNGFLDSHNTNGDAQHAALSIADPTVVPTGYDDFVGWFTDAECTAAVSAIPFSSNGSVTLYAKWTPIEYSITYNGIDGATFVSDNPDTYTIESSNITLNNPTKTGYTFTGWTGSNGETPQTSVTITTGSTGDKSYTANWTINTYTITFVNWDGTELQSSQMAYGETPAYTGTTPTRAADAQYTYTFTGWSPAIATVTGDAIYTAQYNTTVNTYTITFENWDGAELQSSQVAYGEMPSYTGSTPTRTATEQYTYTFTGWSPAITAVTGNATYTAQFTETVNTYTITFENYDGTELQSSQVAYGETPTYTGPTPTRAADAQYTYTFTGWSPEIVAVTANATYTAQYSAVEMLHDVPYRAYNTTSQQFETLTATTCTRINSQLSTLNSQLSGGWYAVNSNVNISDLVNVTGTVNLILCDGATLTASQGFALADGAALNIYGQTGGTGILSSGAIYHGHWSYATDVVIHGGHISVTGEENAFDLDDFTIYGGVLDVTGFNGGIYAMGSISINGGEITINTTNDYYSGIIGDGCDIVINGGNVDITTTGQSAIGIFADYSNLTINGGNVTVNASGNGSYGLFAIEGNIIINGGNISATATGNESHGIATSDGNITLGWSNATDRIYASDYYFEYSNTLSIHTGQSFWNGTESVSGTISDFSKVNGLTLIPNTTTDLTLAVVGGWQAISSPMFNNSDNTETIADVTGLATGSYDMFRYNESEGKWENQKAGSGAAGFTTMERGRGYIYRRSTTATLTFLGQPHSGNFAYAGTGDVDNNSQLSTLNSQLELNGFHLVGNPYNHAIYMGVGMTGTSLADGYYELRPDGTWLVHTDSDPIAVGQAVLVKATQACELSFTDDASKSTLNCQLSTLNSQLSFSVTDGTHTDIAYAVLESLVTDHSSLKKIGHLEPNLPTLSIPQGTDRYAIAAFDQETEQFEMDFTAPDGTYTLQVNSEELKDKSYLHLIDRATGKDIDLLSQPTYTFTHSSTQSITPRFLVKLSPSQLSTLNSQFAYQQGDHIVITGTGTLQAFDLLGRKLFTKDISTLNSQLSTLNFPSTGVYILRLNEKTQKIVIK